MALHDGVPALLAQPQTWRVVPHDDCTYSLSTPDGVVLGVDIEAGRHEVVAGAGRRTTFDAAGSLNRWHLLADGDGRTLHSKFTGMPVVLVDGQLVEGSNSAIAAVWTLTAAAPLPTPGPSTPAPSTLAASSVIPSRPGPSWTRLPRTGA